MSWVEPFEWLLVALVLSGAAPLFAASVQMLFAAIHGWRNHYGEVEPFFPRVAVLVPAWNEGLVIGASVDRLMRLDYPRERLRIYVVDDASTDETPEVLGAKERQYPGNVFHLRRDNGGQGKAHTLNHGLGVILGDDWAQAVLIMDADVIYTRDSLRLMARHLADPAVGAVTAYIKEGSRPGNSLNKFIAYEYITAQAAARRSQNVMGAMACLAGGAQLHERSSLEAIGGRIDTSSLAEDTFTTFNTQLAGRRVVFEPHAVAWAEEPDSIVGLWKQRLRWARGNVQVTRRFRRVWFRRSRSHGLGAVSFGIFWYCLLLLPAFMIVASVSLVILDFENFPLAWKTFHALWITNAATYVFITVFCLFADPETGRRVWVQALLYPGIINLAIIVYTCRPSVFAEGAGWLFTRLGVRPTPYDVRVVTLLIYVWLSASLLAAWLMKVVEPRRFGHGLSRVLLYVVGYGPLLSAVTFASYVKEMQQAEMTWDKTEKTGKAQSLT